MFSVFQAFLASFAAKGTMSSAHEYEGKIAEVVEPGKIWRVYYKATYWSARAQKQENLRSGDWVKVIGRQGLVLLIEPMNTRDR
jgi:membrane protein implicated in regulation of membrane protease activity